MGFRDIIVFFFVLVLLFLGALPLMKRILDVNDGKYRLKNEMLDLLNSYKDDYEQLNKDLLELNSLGLTRLGMDWSDPDYAELGISSGDIEILRRELKKVKAVHGVFVYQNYVKYFTYVSGLSVSGNAQGLYYSEEIPKTTFYVNLIVININ